MMELDFQKLIKAGRDECYTTRAEADKLVDTLLKHKVINLETIIWLPFDTEYSRIYQALVENGFKNLIRTSLADGKDFYLYEPEVYDVIISNPPFSNRTKLFKRLFNLEKPFVMLQATQTFNNQFLVKHMCEKDMTLLMPRTRMNFMTYDADRDVVRSSKGGAAYYSFWLTYGLFKNSGGFIAMADNGREKDREELHLPGNPVYDNYINLFNWRES